MVRHTRSGLPPRTTATAGSSQGRNGEPASETTQRSARLPGASEPTSSSRPSASCRSQSSEPKHVGRRHGARVGCRRSRESDRGAHLVEHVEAGGRGGAVRAEADAEAGLAQRAHGSHSAPEQRVRAWTMHDRHVVLGEELDLLLVDRNAVSRRDGRAEEALAGEVADRRTPWAARQEVGVRRHRPGALDEPVVLGARSPRGASRRATRARG